MASTINYDPSYTEDPIQLVFKKGEPVNVFKNAAGDSYYQYAKNEGGPEMLSSPPGLPVARIVPVVDMPLTVIQDSETVATIVEGNDFQNFVKVAVAVAVV